MRYTLCLACLLSLSGAFTTLRATDLQVSQNSSVSVVRKIFREKGSGRPLERVEVRFDDQVFYSDPDGRISVTFPSAYSGDFEIYRDGYVEESLSVEVFRNDEVIFLYPDIPQNQVVIRGKRNRMISSKQVSAEEVREVTPRGDPAQITRLLPGVQVQGFRPEVVIRGSAPGDSLYYVDGMAVPFVYHSIGGISVLPKKLVSQVNFQSGGFSAEWGNATGGVIVLETPEDIPGQSLTQMTLNVPMFASVFHERPLSDHEGISVSVRKSFLDYIIPSVSEDDLIVPGFYDAHARYLQKRDDGYLKVMALSSSDRLRLELGNNGAADESGKARFDIGTYFGTLGLTQRKSLSEGWSYTVSPQVLFSHIDNDFQDNFVRINAWSYRMPFVLQKRLGRRSRWQLGAELEWTQARVSIRVPRIDADDPFPDFEDAPVVETRFDGKGYIGSAWTSVDVPVADAVFTPGLRVFRSSDLRHSGADPRMTATWDLTKDRIFRFAVGRYSRSPEYAELDQDYGNPELSWELSDHYILGVEQQWGQSWTGEFQLYAKENTRMVQSDPILRYSNSGRLRSRGLEIFLRKNLTGRWFGWLSYTWSVTEEKKNELSSWRPSENDQTHVINLVGAYKLSGQWTLGGRLNYHSGDRYTPIEGAVFNTTYNKYQPRYRPDALYESRLPAWHQADLYTSWDQLYDYFKIRYRFGVEFLSAERQAFGVAYNYDYSKKDYFRGIPPIPYIEVTGEF
ncbi:MAG: TonB-dependent receptor plug domain-containing protein [Deltaproteobacteria bacterium]|nr:TonB-dependent receptor plug domain-containing protein [Deltaproteobacteria bacterium]